MSRRPILATAAVILLLAGTTACGPVPDEAHLVRIGDDGSERGVPAPGALSIEVGSEVRWYNAGTHTHVLSGGEARGLDSAGAEWEPVRLTPGDTVARIFDVPGEYLYRIGGDPTFGTIIVEPAA